MLDIRDYSGKCINDGYCWIVTKPNNVFFWKFEKV